MKQGVSHGGEEVGVLEVANHEHALVLAVFREQRMHELTQQGLLRLVLVPRPVAVVVVTVIVMVIQA